jgi:hypothetical protein
MLVIDVCPLTAKPGFKDVDFSRLLSTLNLIGIPALWHGIAKHWHFLTLVLKRHFCRGWRSDNAINLLSLQLANERPDVRFCTTG